jgi:hypothetical protein
MGEFCLLYLLCMLPFPVPFTEQCTSIEQTVGTINKRKNENLQQARKYSTQPSGATRTL